MAAHDVPRLDPDVVEGWLRGLDGWAQARISSMEPLDGYSSINRRVTVVGAPTDHVVLKVQPTSGIFEPYDVLREAEVLRRLAPTCVPVPEVFATEADTDVLGSPFFAMEWIDAPHLGVPASEGGPDVLPFDRFFAAVVDVHAVDLRAAGLDFLGVPATATDAFQVEVELVARRMEAHRVGDPLLVEARDHLRQVRPDGGRLGLCQGDVNVFNYLVRDGEIVGVVDWEQARIGDPRSDLGQLLALMALKGVPLGPADDEGFVAMYRDAGGTVMPGMEAFRALWFFQLGYIHRAYTTGRGEEPWYSWEQIEDLLPRALASL
jgi:aminoglycoside phosphotransferase (APT) family kinase protein